MKNLFSDEEVQEFWDCRKNVIEFAEQIARAAIAKEKKKSPAVAVPDNFVSLIAAIKQHSNGDLISIPDDIETEEQFFDWLNRSESSPRITEQDARVICESFQFWSDYHFIEGMFGNWLDEEGNSLLNKLNAADQL